MTGWNPNSRSICSLEDFGFVFCTAAQCSPPYHILTHFQNCMDFPHHLVLRGCHSPLGTPEVAWPLIIWNPLQLPFPYFVLAPKNLPKQERAGVTASPTAPETAAAASISCGNIGHSVFGSRVGKTTYLPSPLPSAVLGGESILLLLLLLDGKMWLVL